MVSVRLCGELSIENGEVDTGLSVEGVIANYTCDPDFSLDGDAERVCQSDGQWNGSNPACQGMKLSMHDGDQWSQTSNVHAFTSCMLINNMVDCAIVVFMVLEVHA